MGKIGVKRLHYTCNRAKMISKITPNISLITKHTFSVRASRLLMNRGQKSSSEEVKKKN